MHDQASPSGIKKPVNTQAGSAADGYLRTDPATQTISSGPVNEEAQDYLAPEFRSN